MIGHTPRSYFLVGIICHRGHSCCNLTLLLWQIAPIVSLAHFNRIDLSICWLAIAKALQYSWAGSNDSHSSPSAFTWEGLAVRAEFVVISVSEGGAGAIMLFIDSSLAWWWKSTKKTWPPWTMEAVRPVGLWPLFFWLSHGLVMLISYNFIHSVIMMSVCAVLAVGGHGLRLFAPVHNQL